MTNGESGRAPSQFWGIYFTDREYARELGDPLRTVIKAPTKEAAETEALRLGFETPWAHPITPDRIRHAHWLPFRHARHERIHSASSNQEIFPSPEEVHTAIKVLRRLTQDIQTRRTGENRVGSPESGDSKETFRGIELAISRLNDWKLTLPQSRGIRV